MKKRLIAFLIRLYPADWRRRYEDEFGALLEDVRPGLREMLDVFCGGVAMQWRSSAWMRFGAVGAVAFLLGAGSALLFNPRLFVSKGMVNVATLAGKQVSRSELDGAIEAAAKRELSDTALAKTIEVNHLYPWESGKRSLEGLLQEMKQDITIAPEHVGTFGYASVQFRYRDPELAQKIANGLALRLAIRAQQVLGDTRSPYFLTAGMVGRAVREGPNFLLVLAVGMMNGMVGGGLAAWGFGGATRRA